MENILAVEVLFDREDAAMLVGIDHRNIEPPTLLQKLQIELAVGLDV
jgi:hypothetical protein